MNLENKTTEELQQVIDNNLRQVCNSLLLSEITIELNKRQIFSNQIFKTFNGKRFDRNILENGKQELYIKL